MKTILIYLRHNIVAFNLKKKTLKLFQNHYPNYIIIVTKNYNEFKSKLPQAHFIFSWYFKEDFYARSKKLKAIFTPAAGDDWVAKDPKKMVKVHYGTFHGEMIFESFLAMLLNFNQQSNHDVSNKKKNIWSREKLPTKKLLRNQTILIIGYGHIGQKIANNLETFGCRIYGFKRTQTTKEGRTIIINTNQQLLDTLNFADHVLLLLPKTPSTNYFFCRQHFRAMKSSAILYNFGRGNCIKHSDILWALKNNIISGAGLDVFEKEPLPKNDPLWAHENVLITPHSSCFYNEYMTFFISELIDIWPIFASL